MRRNGMNGWLDLATVGASADMLLDMLLLPMLIITDGVHQCLHLATLLHPKMMASVGMI